MTSRADEQVRLAEARVEEARMCMDEAVVRLEQARAEAVRVRLEEACSRVEEARARVEEARARAPPTRGHDHEFEYNVNLLEQFIDRTGRTPSRSDGAVYRVWRNGIDKATRSVGTTEATILMKRRVERLLSSPSDQIRARTQMRLGCYGQ